MTAFLQTIFTWSLTTACVGACMLALSQLLRKKISARSEYMSWIAVLLLVLLLPIKPQVNPALTISVPAEQAIVATADVQKTQTEETKIAVNPSAIDNYVHPNAQPDVLYPAQNMTYRKTLRITWPMVLTGVYLLGAGAMLTNALVRHVRFMRRIRRWQKPVTDLRIQVIYDRVREEMNVKRRIPIYVCPAADSPMVAGVIRPKLLLPDEHLNFTELTLVLRHELTHIKRHDLIIKVLQMVSLCLHWFNPLVHVMNHAMHYACEASCDESVVRGADMDARQYYSETIIAVIRRQSHYRTALSTSFYGGKKGMKNRILTIMDPRVRRLGALLMVPVLLMSLFFTVAIATEPAKTAEPFVSGLDKETGDLITKEEATQIAFDALKQYDDLREFEVVNFEIREITWMDTPVETAVVRMQLKENPEIVKIAYITARGKVPLEIRQVASYNKDIENSRWLDIEYVKTLRKADYPFATLPQTAYITTPTAGSANICNATTSYDWPQGTYYNGVKVQVIEAFTMLNNVHMTNDNTVTWAHVDIDGVEGWMPLPALTHESKMLGEPAALPTATLATDSDTGYVTVYKKNDFKSAALESLSRGTAVTLLGRLRDFYHVQLANGKQGFVAIENIRVDDNWQAQVTACEPKNYDQLQPGFEALYDEYMNAEQKLWDKYGDSNDWPLEIRAQRTQLQLTYGFDCEEGRQMHILPGEGDMTQAQAEVIANQQILEKYGMGPETYYGQNVYFYYFVGEEDVRIWQFRYSATAGYHDSWVKINSRTGEVIEVDQVDYVSEYSGPRSNTTATQDELAYYFDKGMQIITPSEHDAAWKEPCIELAKEKFFEVYPEHTLLQSFETVAQLMHDGEGLKWYLVDIMVDVGNDFKTGFSVIVTLEDEQRIFHTPVDSFRENIKAMKEDAIILELEKTMGRFFTWSLEDQAKYRPDSYTLPTDDMISAEKAIEIAKEHLLLEMMTEEELQQHKAFTSLVCIGDAVEWRIHFYTDEAMNSDVLDGYEVVIEPYTGEVLMNFEPGGNG